MYVTASDPSLVNMCGIALNLCGVHIEGHLGADGGSPVEQKVRIHVLKRFPWISLGFPLLQVEHLFSHNSLDC